MRILIIDDTKDKRERIAQLVLNSLKDSFTIIEEADTYEKALSKLQANYYDLVILDLLLPATDGTLGPDSSKALIKLVTSPSALVPPMHIIGLTAYEKVAEEERIFFDEHLLSLEFYSAENAVWADKIAARVAYLVNAERASAQFHAQNFDFDVFVLAARHQNEFVPIKTGLFKKSVTGKHPLWKDDITTGYIELPNGRSLRAALCCVNEMGMAPTAALAAHAISVFRPRLIAMVGMCCGFGDDQCSSPRKLVDVIVAREVSCWEEGKYEDSKNKNEFKNRAKTRMVDDLIRNDVERIVEQTDATLGPALRRFAKSKAFNAVKTHFNTKSDKKIVRDVPEVKYSSIVSGSSVIADSKVIAEILSRHPNAIGLDMELFGLYTAVERTYGKRPSVIGVKGVADFGEYNKDDAAQVAASTAAIEVFKGILEHLSIFDER